MVQPLVREPVMETQNDSRKQSVGGVNTIQI